MMLGRSLLGLAFVMALAACNQQPAEQPAPVEAPAVVAEPLVLEAGPWRGFPTDASVAINGDTLSIPQNGGAMRVANNPAPGVGDTLSAHLRLTAAAESTVRIALVRHCNPDRGEEGDSREITLSPTETDLTLQHTFTQPYDCVRVHIVSTGAPAVVTVNEFSLSKAQ